MNSEGVLDADDPDHALAWPRVAVARELSRVLSEDGQHWAERAERVLRCSFDGDQLADSFGQRRRIGGPVDLELRPWLSRVRRDLDVVPESDSRRRYWSERTEEARRLDFDRTVAGFIALGNRISRSGDLWFWAEAFGVDCPDGIGDPILNPVDTVSDLLARDLRGLFEWPLRVPVAASWRQSDLFDFIEVLHDLAAWPRRIEGTASGVARVIRGSCPKRRHATSIAGW